ncbi:MAG: Fe-Mn family superoxide dismutase [Chlamydiota bacterium]
MSRKLIIFLGSLGLLCFSLSIQAEEQKNKDSFLAKDFSSLLELPGWNKDLLLMHFTLYQGYVKNANSLSSQIAQLSTDGKERSYEFGALKRRLGWEYDGMRLHELYFENLGVSSVEAMDPTLLKRIKQDFGSLEAWKKDFIATGLIRGIGWVVLVQDPITKKLYNTWINEHDVGHFIHSSPLLIMDVFEHAYITQFALDKEKYIQLFFQSINWQVVSKRWLATGCITSRPYISGCLEARQNPLKMTGLSYQKAPG